MIRREEKIRIDSREKLDRSFNVIPEFISKMPSEIGAASNCKLEFQDEEEDGDDSGVGMVLGMSFGIAIGAALGNISLFMIIGLAIGILLDARMGCMKSNDK
jgi:hypothetical protein